MTKKLLQVYVERESGGNPTSMYYLWWNNGDSEWLT